MARSISKAMAGILQELELENATYITAGRLQELAEQYSLASSPSLIASRLKKEGWLIATSQRGVWEFVPAAVAGVYSKNDPLMPIKSFMIANPDTLCYLCMQSAAWVLGVADRLPSLTEAAFPEVSKKHLANQICSYYYKPNIEIVKKRGVPCLAPESLLVHMTTKPSNVRSWEGVLEWLPDLIYETDKEILLEELKGRPNSVLQRTGYLLQSMYPDAAEMIKSSLQPHSKVRFGPRKKALRNDEEWMISDTILPISPSEMEKVK